MMENLESPQRVSSSPFLSDLNTPKDYSLASLELCIQSDKINQNNITPISRSMKLKFGVDRLLSNTSETERIERSVMLSEDNNNINLGIVPEQNSDNHHLGLNLLHQQLIQSTSGISGHILKPFPLRFGNNHNRYSHHSPSYFQSNNRKVPITSNLNLPTAYSTLNSYHSVIRLPPQLSPNNGSNSSAHYFTQKKDCDKGMINSSGNTNVKRKRSWSRAVFSNLQRKGLERQFEFQKYITKPDRKKLAARLGLKDAQVKVWFQNRRMKWRHTSRTSTVPTKSNSHENLNDQDEDHFTSSDDEDIDIEIDVVTDH